MPASVESEARKVMVKGIVAEVAAELAATARLPSALRQACHGVLCGCVLGFIVSIAALPNRRVPLRPTGPCNDLENATATLPLCPKSHKAAHKVRGDAGAPAVSESSLRAELERRQQRMERAEEALRARSEADRKREQEREDEAHRKEQRLIAWREASPSSLPQEKHAEADAGSRDREAEETHRRQQRAPEARRKDVLESQRREKAEEARRKEPRSRDCHTATRGETCFKHVVWSMREGVREHPEWYPGLSTRSSFTDFQYVLNATGSNAKCLAPCVVRKERPITVGCHTVSPGEDCYRQTLWAMTHGIYEHPEWYGKLTNASSFEAFQDHLRTSQQADCPRPCSPRLSRAVQ
mmetsp:Transcript_18152/g.56965  ORF Transcript_18152/g.56965 Transcript_18152/m.56965 type:complete len:353 (-) Transcript_18152:71-1129(-)